MVARKPGQIGCFDLESELSRLGFGVTLSKTVKHLSLVTRLKPPAGRP